MANAFVYMFVVGSGAAAGVAVVGVITYLLLKKMAAAQKPSSKKTKRGVI